MHYVLGAVCINTIVCKKEISFENQFTAPFTENSRMSTRNSSELDLELGDLLQEFNDVVKELSTSHASEHVLRNVKKHPGLSDGDDSDYCSEASLVNSLNASQEELNNASMTMAPKVRLGDNSDLQSFIENLDRELAEM